MSLLVSNTEAAAAAPNSSLLSDSPAASSARRPLFRATSLDNKKQKKSGSSQSAAAAALSPDLYNGRHVTASPLTQLSPRSFTPVFANQCSSSSDVKASREMPKVVSLKGIDKKIQKIREAINGIQEVVRTWLDDTQCQAKVELLVIDDFRKTRIAELQKGMNDALAIQPLDEIIARKIIEGKVLKACVISNCDYLEGVVECFQRILGRYTAEVDRVVHKYTKLQQSVDNLYKEKDVCIDEIRHLSINCVGSSGMSEKILNHKVEFIEELLKIESLQSKIYDALKDEKQFWIDYSNTLPDNFNAAFLATFSKDIAEKLKNEGGNAIDTYVSGKIAVAGDLYGPKVERGELERLALKEIAARMERYRDTGAL